MRKILFITLLILISGKIAAQVPVQNQFSQFGSSASGMDGNLYDRNGNPIDTTAVIDASTIPIGLSSWTIDERIGIIT